MSPRRDAAPVRRADSGARRPASGGTRAGFTLIEIIVVLAVVATLAAVVAPALFRHVGAAREQRARQEIAMLDLALRAYRLDNGMVPTTEQGLDALRTRPSLDPVPWRWNGPYLRHPVPVDPWGRRYVYAAVDTGAAEFDLRSLGRDGLPGGEQEDADLSARVDSAATVDSARADSVRGAPVQP